MCYYCHYGCGCYDPEYFPRYHRPRHGYYYGEPIPREEREDLEQAIWALEQRLKAIEAKLAESGK